jgi:hypothetical protein
VGLTCFGGELDLRKIDKFEFDVGLKKGDNYEEECYLHRVNRNLCVCVFDHVFVRDA